MFFYRLCSKAVALSPTGFWHFSSSVPAWSHCCWGLGDTDRQVFMVEQYKLFYFFCVFTATTKQNVCCKKIHSHLCGAGWRTAQGSGRCRAAAQWDQREVRPPPHPAETQQSQHSNVLKAGIILIKEHIIPLMHLLIHASQASRSVQRWKSLYNLSNRVKMHRHEGKHTFFFTILERINIVHQWSELQGATVLVLDALSKLWSATKHFLSVTPVPLKLIWSNLFRKM